MDQLQTRLDALEQRTHTVERQLHWWRVTALLLLALGLVSLPLQAAHTQGPGEVTAQAQTLEQRVAALEAKLTYLNTRIDSSGHPLMEVKGANLRIVNGTGRTESANGLGNLIVGYNEIREFEENTRTGSHNVVVGREHNYFRFGGLVVGAFNTISGAFAVVSGGNTNTATGNFASISGGRENRASGFTASISGGQENMAEGAFTSISGGIFNTASGSHSSVSGGSSNEASGISAVVSGGGLNRASGDSAAVSGGQFNTASGDFATVSGGQNRTAGGDFDWVAGSLVEDD